MSNEYTLSIIKPDATKRNLIGQINSYFEKAGLQIAAQKMVKLTEEQGQQFYYEHKERPFFDSLIKSITAGPVILQVLKGENAIALNREIMGATNPKDANPGTIRKDFAIDIESNSVHGSDSATSAEREIAYFFAKSEILL
jgi:nucleoside-diphosphate kinase